MKTDTNQVLYETDRRGNSRATLLRHMPRRARRSVRAMTLIELVLALSITAVIALAIFSMLFAVTRGTGASQDSRSLLVRRKVVDSRLSGLLRSSRMLLAKGSNYAVLWVFDSNASGTPNRSEIRYLEWNTTTKELWSYKTVWPAAWTPSQIAAANTEYSLSSAFGTAIPALKTDPNFPGERWDTAVSAMSFTPNLSDLQSSTLVTYNVTLNVGGAASEEIVGTAALHNAAFLSEAD